MGDNFDGLFADYPPMEGGIAWPIQGADGWYTGAWRFPQITLSSEYTIEIRVADFVDLADFQTTIFGPPDAECAPTIRIKKGKCGCDDKSSSLQISVTISDAKGDFLPLGCILGFRFLPIPAA